MIHDHPVWIKVLPKTDRMGYYPDDHWHIADIKKLKGMLVDAKADPKKKWHNTLLLSVNKAEFFYTAIWNDGKNDLEPTGLKSNKDIRKEAKEGDASSENPE